MITNHALTNVLTTVNELNHMEKCYQIIPALFGIICFEHIRQKGAPHQLCGNLHTSFIWCSL